MHSVVPAKHESVVLAGPFLAWQIEGIALSNGLPRDSNKIPWRTDKTVGKEEIKDWTHFVGNPSIHKGERVLTQNYVIVHVKRPSKQRNTYIRNAEKRIRSATDLFRRKSN